jgi:hypothetical protein
MRPACDRNRRGPNIGGRTPDILKVGITRCPAWIISSCLRPMWPLSPRLRRRIILAAHWAWIERLARFGQSAVRKARRSVSRASPCLACSRATLRRPALALAAYDRQGRSGWGAEGCGAATGQLRAALRPSGRAPTASALPRYHISTVPLARALRLRAANAGRFDGLQELIASYRAHRRRSRACGRL